MTEQKTTNKKLIGGMIALVVCIAAFAVIFMVFRQKPVEGIKNITIEVIDNNQKSITYPVKTDVEYLGEAMEQADGLTFTCDASGFLTTVNGITPDWDTDHAYWAFYVNDEYGQLGMNLQPIKDGDSFRIEYTISVE